MRKRIPFSQSAAYDSAIKKGHVAGLKEAYALVRRARLHQIALGKKVRAGNFVCMNPWHQGASAPVTCPSCGSPIWYERRTVTMQWPPQKGYDLESWTEHAANVLHALCLRMQEKIKEASK